MKMHVKEREIIVGAAALATVVALPRIGIAIPALGPVSRPLVTILIGFALAGVFDGGGTVGDVVEGIGFGLIARGAMGI